MAQKKNSFPYLHGFSNEEQNRLYEQARSMEHIVYRDLNFNEHSNLLEVGCGVGAQSEILLRRHPDLKLTGIDISSKQLNACKAHLKNYPELKSRYKLNTMADYFNESI